MPLARMIHVNRVPREAYLVFPRSVQCVILDGQLNIQHCALRLLSLPRLSPKHWQLQQKRS